MDNYKIRVNNEAESKEAQELFFELGYEWRDSKRDFTNLDVVFIYAKDGVLTAGFNDHNFAEAGHKELTLPQLRDLVVLKRNDANDANVYEDTECSCLYNLYLTADRELYFYHCGKEKWIISSLNHDEDYYATLKPIKKSQPQDPALISGADALRALACGRLVQWTSKDFPNWTDLDITNINAKNFIDEKRIKSSGFKYRLKPQTIKLELEIPAPCKAKIGGRDDASFVLNVGRHQYCYNNEEDYTKARDALEAVFDSAVRGTNS